MWKGRTLSQIAPMNQPERLVGSDVAQISRVERATTAVEAQRHSAASDKVAISEEAQRFSALKTYVRQLLEEQGIELQGSFWDGMSVEDAQATIAEGGEWSAEAVSDRIIDFVANISGGDPEKSTMLREAVRQGFDEARKAFGGWLPEVSERTYDLIMERFGEAFEPAGSS